jgi:hypothetical protein
VVRYHSNSDCAADCGCRYHKQSSMGGMLQPAGSLASSMSNLSNLQLQGAGGAGSRRGAAAAGSSTGNAKGSAAGKGLSAAGAAAAAAAGAGRAPGSQYVSPYGQQRR